MIASAILNAYLTPSLLYGWIRWRRDSETRPVHHVRLKFIPMYVAATALAYAGALAIVHRLNGEMLFLDAIVLVGSILAQFMLDNKVLENWWVWLAVDVVAIVDYVHAGLYLVAFQFAFFLLNCLVGWFYWWKSYRREAPNDSLGLDGRNATYERALASNSVC